MRRRFSRLWWKPRHGLDPRAALVQLTESAWQWFPRALDEGPSLPESPPFQHAFAGLVMLADWVGSDRHETLFAFSEEGQRDRMSLARDRAHRALQQFGIDAAKSRAVVLGKEPFATIAPGLVPRAAQKALLELRIPAEGSIAVLEAETGSGKTEAALARFIALFSAGCVDGMMFALPTRTAATQIFQRVVTAVSQAFPDQPRTSARGARGSGILAGRRPGRAASAGLRGLVAGCAGRP